MSHKSLSSLLSRAFRVPCVLSCAAVGTGGGGDGGGEPSRPLSVRAILELNDIRLRE